MSFTHEEPRNPFECFNDALKAFARGELTPALVLLRAGFFENLYIAPILLGEECHLQNIWYAGADGEPMAAREYVTRYGSLWEARPDAMALLRVVWSDPLVRAELRSFINLSRNLLGARDSELDERLRERDLFLNPARLERTQSEILARLEKLDLSLPVMKPRLALVLMASRDPGASAEFYRKLLGVEPARTSRVARGFVEFELEGVHLAIHGHDKTAASDPYRLGPPPECLGWGAVFVFRVAALDHYRENALREGLAIVDSDLSTAGRRSIVVKDPSGYLVELTEEEPRALEKPAPARGSRRGST